MLIIALKECGYQWIMVQEDSVERTDGSPLTNEQKYVPNQLIVRNAAGESASLIALVKTQGSDTKLVGQMQPCYQALSMGPQNLQDRSVPSLVTQIADGENGGVMMNEFPPAYRQANLKLKDGDQQVCAVNGREYLDILSQAGLSELITLRFKRLVNIEFERFDDNRVCDENVKLADVIDRLKKDDPSFTMEGASWTNNLSWVKGYENVLEPMSELSARFHAVYDQQLKTDPTLTRKPAIRGLALSSSYKPVVFAIVWSLDRICQRNSSTRYGIVCFIVKLYESEI